jgi:hypothetical protein
MDMAEREVAKIDIALEYLDAAITFFLTQRNFFCAIHLAAVAEELFGGHLAEEHRIEQSALKAEKALLAERGCDPTEREVHRSVKKWKNEVKHMGSRTASSLHIDEVFAADYHIEQALINFYRLGLQKSPAIWRYEDFKNASANEWRYC